MHSMLPHLHALRYVGVALPYLLCPSVALARPVGQQSLPPEIVVIGTKKAKAERVKEVAAAISVFDEAEIEVRKLRDLQGLTYSIPGVSLDAVGTFRGTANFSIRGLGINSSIASVDPTVGTFVDGVYMGSNAGVLLDLFDVQRIEVLRGPQGTLHGRNTTGGAILLETANPTSDWQVKALSALEGPIDGGRGAPSVTVQSSLSGPLANGVAFRLSAYFKDDGGYFRNRFNDSNLGDAETVIVRGGLSYMTGPLRLLLKGEFLDSGGDGAVGQNHGLFSRDTFDVALDNEGKISAQSAFGTLRADYDLDDGGMITNIAGYRKYDQRTDNDIDSTSAFLFHSQTALRQEQVSNELRYAGSLGALGITVGAYYFHQQIDYQEDRFFPAGRPQSGGGRQRHQVLGVFGQGEYALADGLSLLAGLNWSREDKAAAVTYVRPRAACSVMDGTCPTTGPNPLFPLESNGFEERRSWDNAAPKLGLKYKAGEDTHFYGTWTRGNRSGGFNVRVTQPRSFEALAAERGTHAYDDERVDAYELGAKLGGLAGRGALNLAVYRSDVRDLQREVNVASLTSGLAQSIFNTADARISGGEAEASLWLGRTRLNANVGHIVAGYRNVRFDISGDGAVGPADVELQLPRVPKWTFGGEIVHSVGGYGSSSLLVRIAYQHRDRYAWTDSNFGWVGASDNLDVDFRWHPSESNISVSLYGRNLLDQVQFGGDTQLGFAGGPFSDGNNRPFDPRPAAGTFSPLAKGRAVGAQLTYSY